MDNEKQSMVGGLLLFLFTLILPFTAAKLEDASCYKDVSEWQLDKMQCGPS